MCTNEGINVDQKGNLVSAVGADAMQLMRVNTILRRLRMYNETGGRMILTRGANPKWLLLAAKGYTGKDYKNNAKGRDSAIADLAQWCAAMSLALPVTVVNR